MIAHTIDCGQSTSSQATVYVKQMPDGEFHIVESVDNPTATTAWNPWDDGSEQLQQAAQEAIAALVELAKEFCEDAEHTFEWEWEDLTGRSINRASIELPARRARGPPAERLFIRLGSELSNSSSGPFCFQITESSEWKTASRIRQSDRSRGMFCACVF